MREVIALAAFQRRSEKGAANGYAELDAGGLVPTDQLGAGSASSSTFLRGDGTWASAGGGATELLVAGKLIYEFFGDLM